MSLSSAINTAQSMLSNTARQTSIVSKNVANSGNPDYSRRSAVISTAFGGSAEVVKIFRAQNAALFDQALSGISGSSAQDALSNGLQQLSAAMGGNDYENAPSTLIASLRDALQTYATQPSNLTAAQTAIAAARDVANGVNAASAATQSVRSDADAQIATDVADLNDLLSQFQTVNAAIVKGTQAGADTSDELDQRDKLLKSISKFVGIDTVQRANNDTVIYTSDGTTLFETVPRTVKFTPTLNYADGTAGNGVLIDGVPLKPGSGADTTAKGSLQALLQLRDDIAPQYQNQLDEIARGLVATFKETDQSGSGLPDMPGLFTWSGGTVPASATVQTGIAASLSVSAAVDPDKGGDPALLRDGGINTGGTDGKAYMTNPDRQTGYSGQLDGFVTGLDGPAAFDPAGGIDANASLLSYSSNSIGWLEQYRSRASDAATSKDALASRTQDALSNATGVSIDEEMSRLLDLEQSYKASAKMVATVDQMLSALMDAVR